MAETKKVVIVGSGVAGLATAIRLAVQGLQVCVIEKNSYPGGKISHFTKAGYHFDTGPSLFTQPETIAELFTLAGEKMETSFSYEPVPVACHYFYEDGMQITGYTDAEKLAGELFEKTGEPKENIHRYLKEAGSLYRHTAPIFLNHSLHKTSTFSSTGLLQALSAAKWKHLFKTLHQVNSNSFSSSHVVQLFNRYATYNGSSPYKAPGMLMLIPHLEYNQGIYYPKGGMISIATALYQLALKKGVQFEFGEKVMNILYTDKKVTGVRTAGKSITADVIVSNADAYNTCKYLVGDEAAAGRIARQERSSSALVFYWGIDKSFNNLGLHNIFFSKDYEAEFDHIFRLQKFYADPTVYLNITAKYEPGIHAPVGKENWFVMVNMPANNGQDWQMYRRLIKEAVINKLNRLLQADIEALIETETVLDPVLIEQQTDAFTGALYGTSSNSRLAAFLRHPNFSSKLQGLYFAGGTVHPGGGIPLCLRSAKIVSELIAAGATI